MANDEQKIKDLEEKIANTPYNKSTQKAIGIYKAQIAKLREKTEQAQSSGGKSEGYAVKKSGDGTVALLGFPSVGKSTLLNSLTDAQSEVAPYAFTTLTVVPGTLEYKHAKIQILDVPGIVHGAASGKGRGSEVLSVLRTADLIIIVIDALQPAHYQAILKEVHDSGIRINKRKPDVKITKTAKDGIKISKTVHLPDLDDETIVSILKTFRINNADVLIRDVIDSDQLIDCIEDNKIYTPGITALNKIDLASKEKVDEIAKDINAHVKISADKKTHIAGLKDVIFDRLDLMRLWMKEPGKDPDLDEPMIAKRNSTVRDICNKLHKDFVSRFKHCRVWGDSAKFPGQGLSLKHTLKDNDIIELHLR